MHSRELYTPMHGVLRCIVHSDALYTQMLLEGPTRQVCRDLCSMCTTQYHSGGKSPLLLFLITHSAALGKMLNPIARVRHVKSTCLQSWRAKIHLTVVSWHLIFTHKLLDASRGATDEEERLI